jgi:antirestriction protein ArdC
LWPGRTAISPNEIQERFEHADAVVAATGAQIRYGGNEAFFSRTGDYIQMPHRHQFSVPDYYATLAHEMIHNAACRIMPRRVRVLVNGA